MFQSAPIRKVVPVNAQQTRTAGRSQTVPAVVTMVHGDPVAREGIRFDRARSRRFRTVDGQPVRLDGSPLGVAR